MNICPSSLAGVILFPRDSKKLFYRSLRTLFPALKLSLHFFTRYTLFVKSRASRITAALILLTCVVCPFIDSFDTWDEALQTGNETEYTFVFVALCVGASYSFARFVLKPVVLSLAKRGSCSFRQKFLYALACNLDLSFLDGPSPPLLSLRI
ncbi:MAG: hypothetical protein DMG93_13310 [Acidobacteria bacterium]|jgi:hypothetical protein|nr:MAG: hypothetical protein DMG93_13310 [Acidobacteriota bacterium]